MTVPSPQAKESELPSVPTERLSMLDRRHVWHPFTAAASNDDPIVIASGKDAVLRTAQGRNILDCISSWWVNLFGHGQPDIAEAIYQQARQLEHVIFAGFTHEPAVRLAETLAGLLPADLNRVFFSDNGSTSVEVALKIAAQYWQNRGQHRHRVLVFDGGYHGDTVGAMSVGVSSGFFDTWKRWLMDVDVVPYPATWVDDPDVADKEQASLDALDQFLDQGANEFVAMIVEPLVQGAAGMRMCRPEFLRAVVDRLRQNDVIVIFDEVMTGFGRTGSNFACEVADTAPDLICLSKGLTGGFMPMGITGVSDRVYESFRSNLQDSMFCHGHSYTANPLGCAAAIASMDLLQSTETVDNRKRIALAHQAGLANVSRWPAASRLRQQGTIAALDVVVDDAGYDSGVAAKLKSWFWKDNGESDGVLIRPLGNVIYLMPPYCMTNEQLETAWRAIASALQHLSE